MFHVHPDSAWLSLKLLILLRPGAPILEMCGTWRYHSIDIQSYVSQELDLYGTGLVCCSLTGMTIASKAGFPPKNES